MRPSMLYNYSYKAGTIYLFLSVRTCWSGIGNIAILRAARVRPAPAASRKPQATSRRPAGVQRGIIAIMTRHSRKAGPSRGRYPRFQWARARFCADWCKQVFPSLKSILSPLPCVLFLP